MWGLFSREKNIETLVEAFEHLKQDLRYTDVKLVLAGEKAWLWQSTMERIESSRCAQDIIVTGTISFQDIRTLYGSAQVFVFPSLYEGFGLPVLEAFASGVPVICANNSSLPEVGGDGALYFEATHPDELMLCVQNIFQDEVLRKNQIAKGRVQLENFSWEKCAKETLEWIRG